MIPIASSNVGTFLRMPSAAPSSIAASDINYAGNTSLRLTPDKSAQIFSLLDAALERIFVSNGGVGNAADAAAAAANGTGPAYYSGLAVIGDALLRSSGGERVALDTLRHAWQIVWTVLKAWIGTADSYPDGYLMPAFGSFGSRWLWEHMTNPSTSPNPPQITASSFTANWSQYYASQSGYTENDFTYLALAWPIFDMSPADEHCFTGRLFGWWPTAWTGGADDYRASDFFNAVGNCWPDGDDLTGAYDSLRAGIAYFFSGAARQKLVEARLADAGANEAATALAHLEAARAAGAFRRLDWRLLGLANVLMSATEWCYWHTWIPNVSYDQVVAGSAHSGIAQLQRFTGTGSAHVGGDGYVHLDGNLTWTDGTPEIFYYGSRQDSTGAFHVEYGAVTGKVHNGRVTAGSVNYGHFSREDTIELLEDMFRDYILDPGHEEEWVFHGSILSVYEGNMMGVAIDGVLVYDAVETPVSKRMAVEPLDYSDATFTVSATVDLERRMEQCTWPELKANTVVDTSFLPLPYVQQMWIDELFQVSVTTNGTTRICRKGVGADRSESGISPQLVQDGLLARTRSFLATAMKEAIDGVAGAGSGDIASRLAYDSTDAANVASAKSTLEGYARSGFMPNVTAAAREDIYATFDGTGRVATLKVGETDEDFSGLGALVTVTTDARVSETISRSNILPRVEAYGEALLMCIVETKWRNTRMSPQTA